MSLHLNAPPGIFKNASHLRVNMTAAEKMLWEELKNNKLNGEKFRKQHPIMRYILDFYNHKNKLCIEIDGDIHQKKTIKEYDKIREDHLAEHGIKVLRFHNMEIFNNMPDVLHSISTEILKRKNYHNG
jgi:very-short-patch-repair endonuclease